MPFFCGGDGHDVCLARNRVYVFHHRCRRRLRVWLGLAATAHFQGNPEGTRSFVDNVLQPLFGPKVKDDVKKPEKPAKVKKVKGTLV